MCYLWRKPVADELRWQLVRGCVSPRGLSRRQLFLPLHSPCLIVAQAGAPLLLSGKAALALWTSVVSVLIYCGTTEHVIWLWNNKWMHARGKKGLVQNQENAFVKGGLWVLFSNVKKKKKSCFCLSLQNKTIHGKYFELCGLAANSELFLLVKRAFLNTSGHSGYTCPGFIILGGKPFIYPLLAPIGFRDEALPFWIQNPTVVLSFFPVKHQ